MVVVIVIIAMAVVIINMSTSINIVVPPGPAIPPRRQRRDREIRTRGPDGRHSRIGLL